MTAAPASRIRLLLVDDHEVVRKGLCALLQQTAHIDVVGEAGSAADAIREARRLNPAVVLMDLRLPDASGVDACREIRSAQPEVRVLFLTSYPDEDAAAATVLAGASGYLLKDIGTNALIGAIGAVAGGGAVFEPEMTRTILGGLRASAAAPEGAKDRRLGDLSEQERRVVVLLAEGKTNKEIAAAMGLSDKTVRNYLGNVFQKFNVRRRAQVAAIVSREPPKSGHG